MNTFYYKLYGYQVMVNKKQNICHDKEDCTNMKTTVTGEMNKVSYD